MALTQAGLNTELTTDPAALGYGPLISTENWTELAALLNAPKAGFTISVGVLPSYRVVAAIKQSDWDALTASERTYLSFVVQAGQVQCDAGEVRAALAGLFPAGSVTRANLVAMVDRPGSRAEEVFGTGVVITYEDVIRAVRGGI